MWMGGTVPTGYLVKAKKLLVDEAAASEVRSIFSRYLAVGSVPALVDELNADRAALPQGSEMPRFSKGKLYYMLANPIYIGKVRHGAEIHVSEHRPIIDEATFKAVQAKLAEQAPRRKGVSVQKDIHLLTGILYHDLGAKMSPIHATKAGKRYRYYISSRLKHGQRSDSNGWRIAAPEIEAIALHQLRGLLSDQVTLADWITDYALPQQVSDGLGRADRTLMMLERSSSPSVLRTHLKTMFHRIELGQDRLRLIVDKRSIATWLTGQDPDLDDQTSQTTACPTLKRQTRGAPKSIATPLHRVDPSDHQVIDLPMVIKRRGIESRIVMEGMSIIRKPDRALVDMIAKAHVYLQAFTDGCGLDPKQVAARFNVHPEDVSRLLPLAFLSPKIIDAMLQGRQPVDLSVRHLAAPSTFPLHGPIKPSFSRFDLANTPSDR